MNEWVAGLNDPLLGSVSNFGDPSPRGGSGFLSPPGRLLALPASGSEHSLDEYTVEEVEEEPKVRVL